MPPLAGDDAKLLDELGDLLFQSYFLALLLSEKGRGRSRSGGAERDGEADRAPSARLRRRRGDTAGDVRRRWERLKVEQEAREGVFHDVPETLPALLLASKVQRRAAAVGFDYPDVAGALADLDEELRELRAEIREEPVAEHEPDPRAAAELGDVLFACVNVARRLNVDPELELRAAAGALPGASRGGRAPRRGRGRRPGRSCRSPSRIATSTGRKRRNEPDRRGARPDGARLAREPDRRGRRQARLGRASGGRSSRRAPRPACTRRSSFATAARMGRQGHDGGRERERRAPDRRARARGRRPGRPSTPP